ncbi:type VI secretion system contractile sheath large subunit, partial [Burkholderia ubonensis]
MSAGFQSDQYTQTAVVSDTHARANSNAMTCMDPDLLDWCLADLDEQLGRQLDAILHHPAFQALESTWRGLQLLVDRTDFRQNVKIEVLDVSKEALHQDFEDAPDIIQSGLFRLTYVGEYDMPGGQPIAAIISAFEFDNRAQDVALLRNISKVAAAAHMPFIGAASPAFFDKPTMEAVAGIRDLPIWFERAEYLKWKGFRETDDARYVALTMPRFLARLPYGPDTLSVR